MNRNTTYRLLVDQKPGSARWNMAVDEVLLDSALTRGTCSLRFYGWSMPSISLGYFQDADVLLSSPVFSGLPAVRRLTGGGAILHHHELTYSCAVGSDHELARAPQELYQQIHQQIIIALADAGVPSAHLRGHAVESAEKSFLCFGRGDHRDILLAGHKILGSAQRRRRGAVLQHGSLLLLRSSFAPEYPGLSDLVPAVSSLPDLQTAFAREIGSLLGQRIENAGLTQSELDFARQLERNRYATLDRKPKPLTGHGLRI